MTRGFLARIVASILPLLLAGTALAASTRDARFDVMIAGIKAEILTDPASAVDQASAALDYARRAKSPHMEATTRWLRGEARSRIIQHQAAEQDLAAARVLVERTAPRSQLNADILLSEGGVLYATGKLARALDDLRRAHDMFRELGDTRGRAKALIMLAVVHSIGKDHATALRYFDQALEVYRGDPGLLVSIHNGRGLALKDLGRLAQAEAEFGKALHYAAQMKSKLVYAQALTNIADVRLDRGKTVSADDAIDEGLALTRQPGASSYHPSFVVLAADAAIRRGAVGTAERLISQRFAGTDLTATLSPDRQAHDVAYKIYSKAGRSDLALQHLAALKRLDDLATETARSNSAAIAAARFDFANQELRIAQLKAADLQKTVAFERARTQTQQWITVGVGATTLLIIGLLAFGLITIRRSRNTLARTNIALGKALTAKTEFLATTSHEIRTPLNGILGMTQVMLADERLDAPTRDRLSVVQGAGITMRALVDDILDVAKIETGKMTLEEAPTDIRRVLEEAGQLWVGPARDKKLTFDLAIADAPQWALVDGMRLRQIIFNLLSNAVKFTPAGSVRVEAAVHGDRWRLTVADTGIGIAPDKHEIIFEPFRQADTGTTRQFGGTGLGLSICRNLSRAMGGDVTVSSEEGKGATFTLELPYQPAAPAEEASPQPAGEGVLVIDRNPITRAMFKALLEPRGGAVAFAASASEAIEILCDRQPAIVLIDHATLQAVENAAAAVEEIAAAAPHARISLLGPAMVEEEQSALAESGVSQFIVKPIAKDNLVNALFGAEQNATGLVSEAA
ncbi:ATP-binding protein [Sphingomonas sp. ABOLG]|uniref:sensor histidine kinase n=1 Tax=Sphingomonas sp. ABOLG TaxID=1985880 RepID=UPI000F7DD0E9|nr:ATP-binding protein [Sphingomonas sp. ABOLG]